MISHIENKIWYFYVVKCCDNTLYAGVTTNIARRIQEHNTKNRGAKYTRARRPVNLIHHEIFKNRSTAQIAESRFKKLTRKQKEKVINNGCFN